MTYRQLYFTLLVAAVLVTLAWCIGATRYPHLDMKGGLTW